MPRVHHLKSWPEPFAALKAGVKPFEIRKDDRGYMVGDILHLIEWDPGAPCWGNAQNITPLAKPASFGRAGGGQLWRRVIYKTPGGTWGLPPDLCVLGVEPCDEVKG